MRRLAIIGSVVALLTAQPALACRQLIPTAKFDHSDIVVDGVATCLETVGKCKLTVKRVYKGKADLTSKTLEIGVSEAPRENVEVGMISVRRCPQTFEPWKSETLGRFYLSVLADGTFFAAHHPDVTEEELLDEKSGPAE